MKRQKNRCLNCYNYSPHFHPERLLKSLPKTTGNEFIFFPSSGDLAWANREVIQAHIDYARKYRDRVFLIQSKDPVFFNWYMFPENVILGTTIESDLETYLTPSKYRYYHEISKAPLPRFRAEYMIQLKHPTKAVTIEPILSHNPLQLTEWIKEIAINSDKTIVYVGYDNHSCNLPEPLFVATRGLIQELNGLKRVEVRIKSLRKAWYEC